jgi:hypothetical protein
MLTHIQEEEMGGAFSSWCLWLKFKSSLNGPALKGAVSDAVYTVRSIKAVR